MANISRPETPQPPTTPEEDEPLELLHNVNILTQEAALKNICNSVAITLLRTKALLDCAVTALRRVISRNPNITLPPAFSEQFGLSPEE